MFSFLVWTILNHEQYLYLIPLHWLHTGWLYNGYPGIPFCCGLLFFIHIEAGCRCLSTQQPNETNLPINHHLSIVAPDFWVEPPINPNWWLSQSPITRSIFDASPSPLRYRKGAECHVGSLAERQAEAKQGLIMDFQWLLGNTWKYYLEILLGNNHDLTGY